ncbi:DUF5690 family protein [Spongorhabdus nitratireducens]
MNRIQNILQRNKLMFIAWCIVASFIAYFSMYAFRKPFNAACYEAWTLFGLDYKSVLLIAQVLGYTLSKFCGIRIISELHEKHRAALILGLIAIAELALLLFALVPPPYNFLCLFLNGLPLGMVWGAIFSYLEGRRFTELLGAGLLASTIISSGFLKTTGRVLIEQGAFNEFWMPFVTGLMFTPLLLLSVWMLCQIPPPTVDDHRLKVKREVMDQKARRRIFASYCGGLVCLLLAYIAMAVCRDFRDNFAVEIWREMGFFNNPMIYTESEGIITLFVLLMVVPLALIQSNRNALWMSHLLVIVGFIFTGGSALLFNNYSIGPFQWMIMTGIGVNMIYMSYQMALYERVIATFRIKGNIGYMVYLSESLGYMASVIILLLRPLFKDKEGLLSFYLDLSLYTSCVACVLGMMAFIYFRRKSQTLVPCPSPVTTAI